MSPDYYYYHNIKATTAFESKNDANIDWLQNSKGEFSFVRNDKKYRFWGKAGYFPVVVLRKGKPWGDFDFNRLKLHIITRGDFDNQLNSFISLLKIHIPDIAIKETTIKYVEICTRYPDRYFDEVCNHIKKAEARFFTTTSEFSFDKRIKGKSFITLGASLLIDEHILNIKTYHHLDNFPNRRMKLSGTRLPKIEVQIYNPNDLDEAKNEAVPLIKAFQECIGFETSPMHEPEYHLIQDTSLLCHNSRLLSCLKQNISPRVVMFPKDITQDYLTHKIACYITPEARSTDEILNYANISRSTLQRALKRLEPYLEKRGHTGIGIYYQIDTNLFEQQPDNNKAGIRSFTKGNGNKLPKRIRTTKQHHQSEPLSTPNTSNNSASKLTSKDVGNGVNNLPFSNSAQSRFVRVAKSVLRQARKSAKSQILPVSTSPHTFINRLFLVTRDIGPTAEIL